MIKTVETAKALRGSIRLPGDKSISHRAVMLGSIAKGRTRIAGLLDCDDCNYTIGAFRAMGVSISRDDGGAVVSGVGLRGLKKPERALYAGQSGTTMRILPGILSGQDFEATIEGDAQLSKRPMKRIVEPLSLMGVDISACDRGLPPITVRPGRVNAVDYRMSLPSAQVKSAILFAALYAEGTTTVEEIVKSRDHTERMMGYFGADLKVDGLKILLKGGKELAARSVTVPADISSAVFFIVGATLLKGSRITIEKVSVNPTRAKVLDIFSKMGANIRILKRYDSFEPYADIEVESSRTKGIVIAEDDIPAVIDELPALFVLASLSEGRTSIKGAGELRVKETDRINSMADNLRRMGGAIHVSGDEIVIEPAGSLKGADLNGFGDHRTVMSMAVAALAAQGDSTIDDASCVSKSFPGFFDSLDALRS